MRKIIITAIIIFYAPLAWAVSDRGDGGRIYQLGASGDFASPPEVIWGLPMGVMAGDSLRSEGWISSDDLTVGCSGISGYPIVISVGAKSLNDNGKSYINLWYSEISGSSGNGVTITGSNNQVANCTLYNVAGNGIDHSSDILVENCIFQRITGSAIHASGGTATTAYNWLPSAGDAKLNSNLSLSANSPCINAGSIISGVHDQGTIATDIAGTQVLTIPDIGAYEYSPQKLYFNANSTGALENGTSINPYHAFTDYTGWSGYETRAGATLILQGELDALDLSGLTDTGAIIVQAWPGKTGSLSGFTPNGASTTTPLGGGSGGSGMIRSIVGGVVQ